MASLCNFPLSIPLPPIPGFSLGLPSLVITLPTLPSLTLPCPLDLFD